MNNNNKEDGEQKPPEIHLVKGGKGEEPDAKTNAQLAAEAMDRLTRGEVNIHDIVILQRYLLKKPPSCR